MRQIGDNVENAVQPFFQLTYGLFEGFDLRRDFFNLRLLCCGVAALFLQLPDLFGGLVALPAPLLTAQHRLLKFRVDCDHSASG